MLVLSRKINESIIIGENIRLTMTAIRGRQVRLAVEAPRDVRIVREELLHAPMDVEPDHDRLADPPRRAHRPASFRPRVARSGR